MLLLWWLCLLSAVTAWIPPTFLLSNHHCTSVVPCKSTLGKHWWRKRVLHAASSTVATVSEQKTVPSSAEDESSQLFALRNRLQKGCIIEYLNQKGSKQLAILTQIVTSRKSGRYFNIRESFTGTNQLGQKCSIALNRMTQVISGHFITSDLQILDILVKNTTTIHVEQVWEQFTSQSSQTNIQTDNVNNNTNLLTSFASLQQLLQPFETTTNPTLTASSTAASMSTNGLISIQDIVKRFFPLLLNDFSSTSTITSMPEVQEYITKKAMKQIGVIYFQDISGNLTSFVPYATLKVNENIRERAMLREFKQRYNKLRYRVDANNNNNTSIATDAGSDKAETQTTGSKTLVSSILQGSQLVLPPLPPRTKALLESKYTPGLKQMVIKNHPWVQNAMNYRNVSSNTSSGKKTSSYSKEVSSNANNTTLPAKASYQDKHADLYHFLKQYWLQHLHDADIQQAIEFLEFLELSPNSKNAKKVLEVMGDWTAHENIEQHVMNLPNAFPADVLEEADLLLQYHLGNNPSTSQNIKSKQDSDLRLEALSDSDERLRRNLCHLHVFCIDNEYTSEVDDGLSIETLPNGQEKLWIHIADVSRFIRPGSALSIEAEQRMSTVYMPDQRISMFPDRLASDLLSLGAAKESFALSCGVILDEQGEILSYEVCPSKISVSHKLSYAQLDDILSHQNNSYPLNLLSQYGKKVIGDLHKLASWAEKRFQYRKHVLGALDSYLKDKTDLSLYVKKESLITSSLFSSSNSMATAPSSSSNSLTTKFSPFVMEVNDGMASRWTITGSTTWHNSSSVNTVAEYMILMSHTIGRFCREHEIPVYYKVQQPVRAVNTEELALSANESPILRKLRLVKLLRPAEDSKQPGLHATSGSHEYVQVTSPIRRYNDLYNHYRLKAALHAASLQDGYRHYAKEIAGIHILEQAMAKPNERKLKLQAIRMVTRFREQYWLDILINRLSALETTFDCMVYAAAPLPEDDSSKFPDNVQVYEAIVLQLGSQIRYKMIHIPSLSTMSSKLRPGEELKCKLYRWNPNVNPNAGAQSGNTGSDVLNLATAFLLVPTYVQNISQLPNSISQFLNIPSLVETQK